MFPRDTYCLVLDQVPSKFFKMGRMPNSTNPRRAKREKSAVKSVIYAVKAYFSFHVSLFIAELRRPEAPPSGAPYSNTYRKAKETHELIFS